ncbi:preprotein translocase subunit SecG [Pseudooceanicola sp.]|uniref:preprotein translocase subunit SecG n=1 Tax=Pseudooceanicola sp. TaxID=1914328 RepID=UPI002636A7D0|nr:preprotein translocase subunit SecG [Pseudooceanicola sp.]MDF1853898.1 preprotein translocase subunit SecG [Pseudooceanicola sp.]
MENVVLIIHLILALSLIGVVLLQRSEGGGLGMGGGSGSGRGTLTALGKVTWVIAAAFITTSIALTVISAEKSAGTSVLDRLGGNVEAPVDGTTPPADSDGGLVPPPASGDGGLTPSAD